MSLLTERELEAFQQAAFDILGTTGVRVEDAELQSLARDRGASVDGTGIIRFPAPVLRELLATVPSVFEISDLAGRRIRVGEGAPQACNAIVTDPWIIDRDTNRPRRPCLEDVRRNTILGQHFDHVTAMSRMDFPVTDFPGDISTLKALETHLLHHDKHYLVYVTSLDSLRMWWELGDILLRGRPLAGSGIFTVAVAVVSPLTVTGLNCSLLKKAADCGFPVIPTICPMSGTTGPYTNEGMLLLGHAENLAAAALTQLYRPGNPFIYAYGPSVSNLMTGEDRYYTVEKMSQKLGGAELGAYNHMPSHAECGGSMSASLDLQAGAESAAFMAAAVLSDASLISGLGSTFNANGMSGEMMCIESAWLQAARSLEAGIDTSGLEAGIDSLRRAGHGGRLPSDGHAVGQPREERFSERFLLETSCSAEGAALTDRAAAYADRVVEGFVSPVPEDIAEGIRAYFRRLYSAMGWED